MPSFLASPHFASLLVVLALCLVLSVVAALVFTLRSRGEALCFGDLWAEDWRPLVQGSVFQGLGLREPPGPPRRAGPPAPRVHSLLDV